MMDPPLDRAATPRVGDPTMLGDEQLLWRMRGRDDSALAMLYDRYAGLLYTLALRIVGDPSLAQEVIQDTFLRCWHQAEQYDPARGRVAAWLMGVTRNRAIDLLRSRSHQARLREQEPLSVVVEPQPDTSERVLLREMVTAALRALPDAQREAIEMSYYAGLTQQQIAEHLGEPLGTVKSRVRTAMERLRSLLGPLVDVHDVEKARDA